MEETALPAMEIVLVNPAGVLHMYYMCDTTLVWSFRCITHVIHTPVIKLL